MTVIEISGAFDPKNGANGRFQPLFVFPSLGGNGSVTVDEAKIEKRFSVCGLADGGFFYEKPSAEGQSGAEICRSLRFDIGHGSFFRRKGLFLSVAIFVFFAGTAGAGIVATDFMDAVGIGDGGVL